MKKRISNYGPDVFFRRIRQLFRYTFICILMSSLVGFISGALYVFLSLPVGSFSLLPKYIHSLIKWELKGDYKSGQIVYEVEQFFVENLDVFIFGVYFGILCIAVSLVVIGILFWKLGVKNQEDSHLRGAEVITKKQLENQMKKDSQFGFLSGYRFGKNAPKIWEEYIWRGMAIIGRPGTGKSNLIRRMMAQDLERNVKYFIIDIDGAYWRRFGRPGKDKILSLRHKDSEYWDFKSEGVVPSLIASYLVERSHSGMSFWWKAGRGIMKALLEHSKDLDDFKEKIAESDGNILKFLNDHNEIVSKVLGQPGSNQSSGVLGNTVLDFSFINDLGYWPKKRGKDEAFSITDWACDKEDTSWVYVVVNGDELEQLRPLIACWFNLAINGCFRRDEELCYGGAYPSMRIVLDELKSLGKLEELEKAGERLRKHRASLILGYQNNAQLDSIYGNYGAENIKDVLQNKVIFSVGDPKAQEDLSKMLGEQEIEEVSANLSYGGRGSDSHTETRRVTRRRVVLPSELGKLADFECYIKISHFDPTKGRIDFQRFANINPALEWALPPRGAKKAKAEKADSGAGLSLGDKALSESVGREIGKAFDAQVEIDSQKTLGFAKGLVDKIDDGVES